MTLAPKDKLLQHIIFNKRILIDLIIIALIGLISFVWFKGNYLIKTGDDFFPLDPAYSFSTTSYFWLHFYSTGLVIDSFSVTNLPFLALLSGFRTIGFSIVTLQQIFYYFTFTFSGISAYFLTTSLLRDNKRVAGLASALFYMMNPYSLSVIWSAHYTTLFFAYSSAPLFLALFIKGIMSKHPGRYAIYVGLLELLFSPMFDDPSEASIILLLIPALFLLCYIIIQRKDKTKILSAFRFCLYFIVVSVVINFWWILPAIYLGYTRFVLSTGAYSSADVLIGGSVSSTIWNSIRLLGFYFIWGKWYPVSIYAWAETYSSAAFVFLSILIPITAFAALTLNTRDKFCLFFALLSVLGLFLAKGVAEPLGNINLWLFQNVPLAVAFRTQFVRFGLVIVLGFTFLIGVTVGELWKRFRQTQFTSQHKIKPRKSLFKRKAPLKVVVLVSILLALTAGFVIYNYPFWNGDVIYPGSKYLPSARIQVPSYYTDAGNYINGQPGDFRIMDIPPRLQGTSAYAWEHGYIASDPIDEYYIHKPLIGVGSFSDIELQLFNMLSSAEVPQSFAKTLALMNCKYLLVHKDFNSSLINAPGINDTFNGFYLEKTFGQLDLYRNEYWTPLQLYSTSNAILVQGNFSDMFPILEEANYTVGDNLLLLSNQLDAQQISALPMNTVFVQNQTNNTSITYEEINPTQYTVHVNSSQPFYLVFSESYDNGWIATINGQQIHSQYHFTANGYANGWYINKTGIYTVTLEFAPQNLFYSGAAISITTLIICIVYVSKNKIKNIYQKYVKKNKVSN